MKYILKFNESGGHLPRNPDRTITQSDFDLIEDLFLFWSDERPIAFLQYPDGTLVEDSKISENTKIVKIFFNYTTSNHPSKRSQTPGKRICAVEKKDFERVFGFKPLVSQTDEIGQRHNAVFSDSFTITNLSDLEDRFGPFPKKPGAAKQKVLRVLDRDYNIKQDLVDIIARTKGLEHYGFNWRMKLILEEIRSNYDGLIIFDLYILLTVNK